MYSTHNEGKFVVADKCIRNLKNNICKYMTSISKNVYIDKLDDIVNKCNNTYHRTIKMKLVDVKSNTYTYSSKEISNKGVMLLVILTEKKLLERYTKKNFKKQIKKSLELKK